MSGRPHFVAKPRSVSERLQSAMASGSQAGGELKMALRDRFVVFLFLSFVLRDRIFACPGSSGRIERRIDVTVGWSSAVEDISKGKYWSRSRCLRRYREIRDS